MRRRIGAAVILAVAACSPGNAVTSTTADQVAGADSPANLTGPPIGSVSSSGATPEESPRLNPAPAPQQTGTPASPVVVGDGRIDYPDALQMVMLGYRLRGAEPPIADWASKHASVKGADEFARAEELRRAQETLQAAWAKTEGVGVIKIRARDIEFSEYDAERKGFFVNAFEPDSNFLFDPFGTVPHSGGGLDGFHGAARDSVVVELDNASDAYLWPLTFEAARDIFERNNRGRWIVVDMVLRIKSLQGKGGQTIIHTDVESYDVFQQMNREARGKLATVSLP